MTTSPARQAFATLFLVLAAHNLLETARDTLFLSRLPASQLPWMYMAVAAVSLVSVQVIAAGQSMFRRSMLQVTLIVGSAISCALWLRGHSESRAFLYALYLWPAVLSSVAVVEFWRVIGDSYTITEAKTVFGRIGAGGTAGALTGSVATLVLAPLFPALHLLLVAGVLLALSALIAPSSVANRHHETAETSQSGLTAIVGSPYLKGVAACLLLTTVVATLADYVFKSVVVREIPAARLPQVFAAVSFAVSAGTLVLQSTVINVLIRRIGVTGSLAILPTALTAAAAVVALQGGLIGAVLLRTVDGTIRYSLHRAVSDLLYVPLSPWLRARTKGLIDVISQRGGQVLGSMIIIAAAGASASDRVLALVVIGLAAGIVMLAVRLKSPYLDLFRATLSKDGTSTRLALPQLDLDSMTELVAAFSSDNERDVIAAMELVAEHDRVRTIPVVMLFHPSHEVVARALTLFERHQRDGFAWAVDRLRKYSRDPHIKAAALAAYARQCHEPSALHAGLADQSEAVRATAIVALISGGWISSTDAARRIRQAREESSLDGQLALAEAIRSLPSPLFTDTLIQLAKADRVDIQQQVALAMARSPDLQFQPALRDMLAATATRSAARRALVAGGSDALAYLERSLSDATVARRVRIHIPRTISRFPAPDAIPVLWRRFPVEEDEVVRFKLLRGLGRLVTNRPDLRPDLGEIERAVVQSARTGVRFGLWRRVLESRASHQHQSPTGSLLLAFLRDKQTRAGEIVFRLLALQHRGEDLKRVFQGLGGSRLDHASGRELIENTLPPAQRAAVLVLTDNDPDPTSLAKFIGVPVPLTAEQALVEIVRASRGALAAVAQRRAAELGIGTER